MIKRKIIKENKNINLKIINELQKKAIKYHTEGDYEEAKKLYHQLIKINPKDADSLHLLGVVAYQEKEYEKAITYIENAIKINSTQSIYYYTAGLIYTEINSKKSDFLLFKN